MKWRRCCALTVSESMNWFGQTRFRSYEWASANIVLMRTRSRNGSITAALSRRTAGSTQGRCKMHDETQALTAQDLAALEKCFISPQLAEQAGLFRVDSQTGGQLIGRNGSGDYSGIVFRYLWPGEAHPREYRLRLDHPDLEQQSDGSITEKGKYLSPPGRGNILYFVPGTKPSWLKDPSLPIIITEGEKKTIALYRLAFHDSSSPRFLPIGLSGVWNWRGVVGKSTDARGERRKVKGVIADFDRIVWK